MIILLVIIVIGVSIQSYISFKNAASSSELKALKADISQNQVSQVNYIKQQVASIPTINPTEITDLKNRVASIATQTSLPVVLNELSVKNFGVVGDGVTDDTEALRKAHTEANRQKKAISYSGINTIAIQSGAKIVINTSVDFANCNFKVLGGYNQTPSWSPDATIKTMFIVQDSSTPLITVSAANVTDPSLNLRKGSNMPTLGVFNGTGYASITAPYLISGRDKSKTDTANYQQVFKVHRNGRVSHPLAVDLTKFNGLPNFNIQYRKSPENTIVLKNFYCREVMGDKGWNSQTFFSVQRNNVRIQDIIIDAPTSDESYKALNVFINVSSACDITIDRYKTTGQYDGYSLSLGGAADIYVNEMHTLSNWGSHGNNHISGLYINNCVLNRVEAHAGGFNIFVRDSVLHQYGVYYGWGGGIISVKNTVCVQCPAIRTRADYGNTFFGELVVDSVEMVQGPQDTQASDQLEIYVVNLADHGTGMGSTAVDVFCPEIISINNITFSQRGPAYKDVMRIVPLRMKVFDTAKAVYAPSVITISNIKHPNKWTCTIPLDLTNMESNGTELRLLVDNIRCTNFTGGDMWSLSGISEYTKQASRTIKTPVTILAYINNVSTFYIETAIASRANVLQISNSILYGVDVPVNFGLVEIDNCNFTSPPDMNGMSLIIGSNNTSIMDTIFGGVNGIQWDLSRAKLLQGVAISTNNNVTALLPTGVTYATAFTGWKNTSLFRA